MSLNKIQVGVAGEYYVAAELSKRGYLASITLRNTKGIDILCSKQDGSKSVTIQVKTNQSQQPRWILTNKAEDFFSESHFYVFVLLKDINSAPEYYVVPSKIVSVFIRDSHQAWLEGTKKDGTIRKDSTIRNFVDVSDSYKDRWDLLGLE